MDSQGCARMLCEAAFVFEHGQHGGVSWSRREVVVNAATADYAGTNEQPASTANRLGQVSARQAHSLFSFTCVLARRSDIASYTSVNIHTHTHT